MRRTPAALALPVASLLWLPAIAWAQPTSPSPTPTPAGDKADSITWVSVSTLVVAFLALVVSVVVGFKQYGLQRRLAELQVRKRTEEEADRATAALSVHVIPTPDPSLAVTNTGQAPATDITVTIASATQGRAPEFRGTGTQTLTVPRLDPARSYEATLKMFLGVTSLIRVTLTWTDGTGTRTTTTECPLR